MPRNTQFLCLLAAGLWWTWFSLSGLTLVDKRHPKLPLAADLPDSIPPGHTTALVTRETRLSDEATQKLIKVMQPGGWDIRVYLPALFGTIVTLLLLNYHHPVLTLETSTFEWVFIVALGFATLVLFGTLFRLLITWLECRKILGTLDRFPVRRAFAQLNFAWEPIWRLGGGRWQDLYRLVARQLETLEHLKREVVAEGKADSADLLASIAATAKQSDALLATGTQNLKITEPALSDYLIGEYQKLQKTIAHTCAAALAYLQPKWWEKEGLILCEVGAVVDGKTVTVICSDKDDKDDTELAPSTRLAERFVALVYLNFILSVLLRMRTLAIAAGGLYILLLLSVNSYPFEPKAALLSVAILMLILVTGMVGYTFAQIHRNSILSLVTQTKPGELGMEFWLRMGVFVALPLLSLLVSQFPALNNALFSWLEPAVSALK